jgi:putative phosphoribosyl transferase
LEARPPKTASLEKSAVSPRSFGTPGGLQPGDVPERFLDRRDAGRRLAPKVASRVGKEDVLVLALPRGGIPVAREVAEALGAPLDVLMVRKVGVPWQPELALGAVSSGEVTVLNDEVVRATGLTEEEVNDAVAREREELDRRERLYREGRPPQEVHGKTVVLVDDGIATGATVRAGLKALDQRGATRRVVACPVAPAQTVASLREEADDVVCVSTPDDLRAIGLWYVDFPPISDAEVIHALRDQGQG